MFLDSEVRLVHRADNLTAICVRMSRQCEILNISQPYRPLCPVMGIASFPLFIYLSSISIKMDVCVYVCVCVCIGA
jgi:hypothetical protein